MQNCLGVCRFILILIAYILNVLLKTGASVERWNHTRLLIWLVCICVRQQYLQLIEKSVSQLSQWHLCFSSTLSLMFSVCAISTKVLAGSIFLLVSKNYPNVSAEILQLTVPITTILTHQGPFTLGATWYDAIKMSRISIVAFRPQATFSVSVGLFVIVLLVKWLYRRQWPVTRIIF